MTKTRRSQATAPAETKPDPRRETPGSYARQADGAIERTDEPQGDPIASSPDIPLESARAMAAALEDVGADVPAHIQAVLDAAAAPAEAGGETTTPPGAESAGGQPE